jgi:hypothetical protein
MGIGGKINYLVNYVIFLIKYVCLSTIFINSRSIHVETLRE